MRFCTCGEAEHGLEEAAQYWLLAEAEAEVPLVLALAEIVVLGALMVLVVRKEARLSVVLPDLVAMGPVAVHEEAEVPVVLAVLVVLGSGVVYKKANTEQLMLEAYAGSGVAHAGGNLASSPRVFDTSIPWHRQADGAEEQWED